MVSFDGIHQRKWGEQPVVCGCHALDALLLCMGGEVEEVSSYASSSRSDIFSGYEYPTTTTTIIKFTDGRINQGGLKYRLSSALLFSYAFNWF